MKTTTPLSIAAFVIACCLAAPCVSWADNPDERFLEFRGDNDTITYDLSTVKMIQPGRFTVVSTTIDNPDVMKFELKVLDTLRTYCARPDGQYPAPDDFFTLGPPDMPIKSIEVESNKTYQRRRDQELACALQLHLRQERRELAHCRPSFLGNAIGPQIALGVSVFGDSHTCPLTLS